MSRQPAHRARDLKAKTTSLPTVVVPKLWPMSCAPPPVMGLRRIVNAVLLLALCHLCYGTYGKNHPNEGSRSLALSRRERAAQAHDDDRRDERPHAVVKRDATKTDQPPDGAGFPRSDGLPPPAGPLPPFTSNDEPANTAPSVVLMPSTTPANGSPSHRCSAACHALCLAACLFLRQTW